jgi:hypothetical protein
MKIWSCLNGAKVCLEDGNEADDDVSSDDNEGQEARGRAHDGKDGGKGNRWATAISSANWPRKPSRPITIFFLFLSSSSSDNPI